MNALKILSSALVIYWNSLVFLRRTMPIILHPVASRLAARVSSFFNHSCCFACLDSMKHCRSWKFLARRSPIKGHAGYQDKKEQKKSPFGPVPIVFYASKEILPVPYFCLIDSFLCPSCSSSVQKFYFFKAGSCGKFRWQYDYC